jgi:hypothetical protein
MSKADQNVRRLQAEIRGLNVSTRLLEDAKDTVDAHLAWANFVRHLKVAILLTVRIGKSNGKTKKFAWQAENEVKRDEILKFLISSRNDLDHPEDEGKDDLIAGELKESETVLFPFEGGGGLVCIEGEYRPNITFSNVRINGQVFDGGFNNHLPAGNRFFGNVPARETPKGFYLKSVTTHKGDVINVPLKKGMSDERSASELSLYAQDWFERTCNQLLTSEQMKLVGVCER